ncbi:MAG: AAA family ATPase [Armatimonadetes bacterium]|nr:AAA family ATPase [Armatimonadota bacterium]
MTKDYSPFTPGILVPADLFVGRAGEVQRLLDAAGKSVARGTLERAFVTGDRGIGKSSLCSFAMTVAEQELEMLGIHVFLGGASTLEEMARRIFERLLKESRDRPWYNAVTEFLGDHVKKVGLFGVTVEFDASQKELEAAVSDFVPALSNLLKQLKGQRRGIMLVMDDINGLAGEARFANWLKSTVDEIATNREPLPMMLVLVGLPERRRQIIERHPSLDRVFDIIQIDRFSDDEIADFYRRTFGRVGMTVSDEAVEIFARYSGGYPAFMHELGDAAFNADEDGIIDARDAWDGVFAGAEVIGAKYVEPKITAAIRSERYRSILDHISQTRFGHHFSRREVRAQLSDSEARVFDNFLKRMQDLGVIEKDLEHGRGHYRFTSQLYYLYLYLQAAREGGRR